MKNLSSVKQKYFHTYENIFTAYHEAGHIVCGLLHFIKIDSSKIFIDKKTKRVCGETYYTDIVNINTITNSNLIYKITSSHIKFLYAGVTVERLVFQKLSGKTRLPLFLKDGSSSDVKQAFILFNNILVSPGKEKHKLKKNLMLETEKNINNHWNEVELISHSLIKKNNLSYNQIKKILLSSENKNFWSSRLADIDHLHSQSHVDERELLNIYMKNQK